MLQNKRLFVYLLFLILLLFFSPEMIEAEKLSLDSPEFAAKAVTKVYPIKKVSAENIIEKINDDEVEVDLLENRDYIVIKALPEKMKEIEKKLLRLENERKPFQVKYNFYIVELQLNLINKFGLEGAETDKNHQNDFQFLKKGELMALAGGKINSNLVLNTDKEDNTYKKIAEPTLVSILNSKASMVLSEEIKYLKEDIGDYNSSLKLEIMPEKLVEKDKRIKTSLMFSSQNNIKSGLATTIWTDYNELELLGVLKNNRKKTSDSFKKTEKNVNDKYFAFYMTAKPVSSLEESKRDAFVLEGLDQLLFTQKEKEKPKKRRARLLYKDKKYSQILFELQTERFGLEIDSFNQKEDYPDLNFGPEFTLLENLRLGIKFQIDDEEPSIKMGLKDKVPVSSFFSLTGCYYPIYYNFDQNNFSKENSWWLKSEISYSRFSLDLKYSELKEDNYKEKIEAMLDLKVKESFSITIGIEKIRNMNKTYLGGISLKNW